jgi:hypothetical protein
MEYLTKPKSQLTLTPALSLREREFKAVRKLTRLDPSEFLLPEGEG